MDANHENDDQVIKITFRELEPLLRTSLGDELIVENYTASEFLLPGENYGSTIMTVDAVIRRTENAEKEDLHMIAKMPPSTNFQRRIFSSSSTFRKETAMYQTVMEAYRQLEKEHGVKESELFDILPKFYGSRFSLDPNIEFDDDAVILLDNLKYRGYYTGRREVGYDLDHSKLAIPAMARFHALGIATRNKKPEVFKKLKALSKGVEIDIAEFENAHLSILKGIQESPLVKEYYDRIEAIFTDRDFMTKWFSEPEGPWGTIIHSDFWVNNIMFHKDEDGHVDDVKFVDFQNYIYSKPVRELIFYLHSSLDDETRANHIEELVDLYYDSFISVLKRMDCDVTPYGREEFDAQFKIDAKFEFVHLAFMIKILTLDVHETNLTNSNMKTVMFNYAGNDTYLSRFERVILYFAERNWI